MIKTKMKKLTNIVSILFFAVPSVVFGGVSDWIFGKWRPLPETCGENYVVIRVYDDEWTRINHLQRKLTLSRICACQRFSFEKRDYPDPKGPFFDEGPVTILSQSKFLECLQR